MRRGRCLFCGMNGVEADGSQKRTKLNELRNIYLFHAVFEFVKIGAADNIPDGAVIFIGNNENVLRLLLGKIVVVNGGYGGTGLVALLKYFIGCHAADKTHILLIARRIFPHADWQALFEAYEVNMAESVKGASFNPRFAETEFRVQLARPCVLYICIYPQVAAAVCSCIILIKVDKCASAAAHRDIGRYRQRVQNADLVVACVCRFAPRYSGVNIDLSFVYDAACDYFSVVFAYKKLIVFKCGFGCFGCGVYSVNPADDKTALVLFFYNAVLNMYAVGDIAGNSFPENKILHNIFPAACKAGFCRHS